MRFSIRKLLEEKIEVLKDKAYKQNWQMILFGSESPKVCVEKNIAFTFSQVNYPAKKFIKVQSVSINIFIQQSGI